MLSRLHEANSRPGHDLKDDTSVADKTIATRVGAYALFEMWQR